MATLAMSPGYTGFDFRLGRIGFSKPLTPQDADVESVALTSVRSHAGEQWLQQARGLIMPVLRSHIK